MIGDWEDGIGRDPFVRLGAMEVAQARMIGQSGQTDAECPDHTQKHNPVSPLQEDDEMCWEVGTVPIVRVHAEELGTQPVGQKAWYKSAVVTICIRT